MGDDGVGDFVRIPDFAPPTGEPAVMIEPSAEGPTFSVIGRPGDPQGPWLDVDTSTIQPDGSGRNWVVDSEGGTSSIPQTNRALTLSEGEQFDQQEILRHLGTEGTFTVPAQDGEPLRFALDLPSLDDEPGTFLQPRPGEAMLNCHVGDACYTFDDAGNVAVTRNGVDAQGRPVTTREYRVTETPNPLPDGLGTPSVTWLFVPGENGGNGSFTAFPGIGDSTDAATTALQVHRDDAGRVLWAEVAGGSSATDPAELDPLDVRDPGDITPPDPRSWRGLHFDMAEPLSVRHATGPNWDLSIPIDRVDREERLVGSVNGVPVGPFDDATGHRSDSGPRPGPGEEPEPGCPDGDRPGGHPAGSPGLQPSTATALRPAGVVEPEQPQQRRHLAVITPPAAPALDRWEQRLDPRPGLVCQLTTPNHPAMITDRRSEPLQDTP